MPKRLQVFYLYKTYAISGTVLMAYMFLNCVYDIDGIYFPL